MAQALARTGRRRQRGYAAIAAMCCCSIVLWLFGIYFTFGLSGSRARGVPRLCVSPQPAVAPEREFAVAVALLGVATAIFEFLTGGIPFGIALLLGIVALDGPDDATALWRRAWHGCAIFSLAVVLTFAVKLAWSCC